MAKLNGKSSLIHLRSSIQKLFFAGAVVFLAAASQNPSQGGRGWQGIVPLHSNRADVVARLGSAEDKDQRIFRTSAETIVLNYAEAPCKGAVSGWNVPRGTVLQLRVTSKTPIPFNELTTDLNAYTQSRDGDDVMTLYYTNIQEGIRYAVQNNQVVSVEYIASTKDQGLRCDGFPQYDAGATQYRPYHTFLFRSNIQMFAHLDDFAFQMDQGRHWIGYIISYAGRVSRRGEAKAVAKSARNYLLSKRHLPPDRVIAIDGGFREKTELELYLIRNTMPAPTPVPTLSVHEVRIIKTVNKTITTMSSHSSEYFSRGQQTSFWTRSFLSSCRLCEV